MDFVLRNCYLPSFVVNLQPVNTLASIKLCYHRIEECYACVVAAEQFCNYLQNQSYDE